MASLRNAAITTGLARVFASPQFSFGHSASWKQSKMSPNCLWVSAGSSSAKTKLLDTKESSSKAQRET